VRQREGAILTELDREEWWDICRSAQTNLTRREFEALWQEFVRLKRSKELR
jgi:hypothetical protein